jgi:SagB-type dehydrogenase family enzyme
MKRSPKILYRRIPHLVSYWGGPKLVFEDYLRRNRIRAEPLACEILHYFSDWKTVDGLARRLSDYDPASLRSAVKELAGRGLLQTAMGRPPAERKSLVWRDWSPPASFLHFATKDEPYTSAPAEERRMFRRRARQWPVPPPVKRYPRSPQVALPAPRKQGEFPQVLLGRRTWRQFARAPLEMDDLGTLLGLTWGIHGWLDAGLLGRLALKTSASGGARHPMEAYVLALNVRGLPRGLYHYAADAHRLELLRRGAAPPMVEQFLPSQWWFRGAAALFVMTAVFPRTQWKYPSPRAYRVVLADAGHLGQTFCLVATWLGLAPFCTMALADTKIERALGIDGFTESALYVAGVGTRRETEASLRITGAS